MTDSPRRRPNEPTEPLGSRYPQHTDPAYANQPPWTGYKAPIAPDSTQRLPAYSPYGHDFYGTDQFGYQHPSGEPPADQPPRNQGTPRWLWVAASIAVVTVTGLVIALVIVNSSRQQTLVAPLPSRPEPSFTTSPTAPPTASSAPSPSLPPPAEPTAPTTAQTTPSATQTVVYTVSGDGRAINITYVDTGGVLQTEFNVLLPWSKQVNLTEPAQDSASVSVINVGRDVNCSISVNGVTVKQRTGAGLTICSPGG